MTPVITGFADSIFAFKKDGVPLILHMPSRTTSSFVREVELMKTLFPQSIAVAGTAEIEGKDVAKMTIGAKNI